MAQIAATPETASPQPQGFFESGRGWVLAVSLWVLAGALVAAVFWVLPRAASSRRLANDKASLLVRVSQARRELEQAREKLVTLQAQLSELQAARDELEGQATKNGRQIAALNKKIKALEGEKKAAEAAAAAAAAAATGGGVGVSSVPPPPIPCHTVYSTNFSPSVYCPSPRRTSPPARTAVVSSAPACGR